MLKTKLFSAVLVITMLVSCGSVYGATLPEADSGAITEAVTDLTALGIMSYDENGDFNGSLNITRAEFAAVICRMLRYDKYAEQLKNDSSPFPDTKDHWANGYVLAAYQLRIINGFEDGTFRPDENITVSQAVKMLICALGYEVKPLSYPDGYLKKAEDIELIKSLASSYEEIKDIESAMATRNLIASLVHNAIDTPLLVQTSWSADKSTYTILNGENGTELRTLRTMNFPKE